MEKSIPWIEKYRPLNIREIKQDDNIINLLKNSIAGKNITHFLFYGPPGTGKTSAILALGREIFKEKYRERVIEFNASDDRGINAVREKICNEARKTIMELTSLDGTPIPPYKIVILDEADSMTNGAQDALRVIIEQYSSVTRFCFICNYIGKISDAIKSRCSLVYFRKLDDKFMIQRLEEIAVNEKMILDGELLESIIEVSDGDMRKAIMILQNLKYLYDYKEIFSKKISEMSLTEINVAHLVDFHIDTPKITKNDIYQIACCICSEKADSIILSVITSKNILEIRRICETIINTGYPVDNILTQLSKSVMHSTKLSDREKSEIFLKTGKIFLKIKNCADEYLQLLEYFTIVYSVFNHLD